VPGQTENIPVTNPPDQTGSAGNRPRVIKRANQARVMGCTGRASGFALARLVLCSRTWRFKAHGAATGRARASAAMPPRRLGEYDRRLAEDAAAYVRFEPSDLRQDVATEARVLWTEIP
jgi:hypothetical protein